VRLRGRLVVAVLLVALVAPSCGDGDGDGPSGGDGDARRVLVDYKHDEFSSSFLAYFPNLVTVHPGDRVNFTQAWTGEPHSVTMGRLVDDLGRPFWDLVDPVFERGDGDFTSLAGVARPALDDFFEQLPFMTNTRLQVVQSAAQPCYIEQGAPQASEPDKPCAVQEQPVFDGRYDYYNSGFIPYRGQKGNTFSVPLADDIEPGTYHYYCNWHSIEMSGAIKVVPPSTPIPSQTEVNKTANEQSTRYTDELTEMSDDAAAGRRGELPVVGIEATAEEKRETFGLFPAIGDEFVPETINARVNEKVTWTFAGRSHSLAFRVPKYFPVVDVADDGTVRLDDRGFRAVRFPAPPDQAAGSLGGRRPPRAPVAIDGGRFDGTGSLRSTGMFYAEGDTFSLTFTRTGTYQFACLVHPAMVGKVVVR
jgi:plastocyanin